MRSAAPLIATVLLTLATGCAKYEYNLVRPPDLTRHIGTKADEVVTVDPLQYRLRTVDNRLVVRVYNPTEDSIELLGNKSTVVDPEGQSHPLRGQTIAPGAFIKLIFPPLRPRVYDYGPTFGIGYGYGYGYHTAAYPYYSRPGYYYYPEIGNPYGYPPYWEDPYYAPYAYGPRYFAVVDENDMTYWDWKGAEGEMRLLLVFQREGKEEAKDRAEDQDKDQAKNQTKDQPTNFRQEFIFRRQKM